MNVHGTCHHDCPDSCGWEVTVEGGVAVKMRGNPTTRTATASCARRSTASSTACTAPTACSTRCAASAPKGEGRFEQITWDEALAEIAARLHDVIDRHGAEAVLPFSDAGNQSLLSISGLDGRFCNHLGASLLERAICGPTVGPGVRMTNGSVHGLDPLELRHSKLILLWGTNTRLTNRHLWPTIEAARADGARIVVIDPIRTMTAESADEFIQPLPGTDIALMLAMMHVLIRDDLVDRPWVDAHTVGFDELAAHVAEWTPERAADDLRRRRRRHRAAGDRLRHDPPGGHPHADRRRAPRERGDVLPHAGRACRRWSARGRTAAAASPAASARGRTRSSTAPPSSGPTCSPGARRASST